MYVGVEIINVYGMENAKRNIVGENEIRSMNINTLVHIGSLMLCINEGIQN